MPRQDERLFCPRCAGPIEARGVVRFYEKGAAVMKIDGHREWVASGWSTPVETLELDDPPFYCEDCDTPLTLDELLPFSLAVLSASPGGQEPRQPASCAQPSSALSGPHTQPEDL